MDANWYIDLTDNHEHSADKESTLVWLCNTCADPLIRLGELQGEQAETPEYDLCWKCGNP